ncbi:DUF6415 family natural product biosynthesis protein [Streptomyces sp. MUM 136J]|uniref:DUF6415 family natural product biosynthesis protein n=1 Tax=Streptomyces sp. MUM 136J TaxID=2791992 RepID=UPI0027E3CCD0|nr:DUF6415 family natural product biosynthesis protein [Streptomyces sp. MUM 136J]
MTGTPSPLRSAPGDRHQGRAPARGARRTRLLRGMITVPVPEVETAAAGWPSGEVPATCARACGGAARTRLRPGPSDGTLPAAVARAQGFARSAGALMDHCLNPGGGTG